MNDELAEKTIRETRMHEFLSDDWINAVVALQEEFRDRVTPPAEALVMNQVIRDVPFRDEALELSVDTRSGVLQVVHGHVDDADVTITTDYVTAKALFVDQDQQAVMQAFMSGKVMVEGDMAKLMLAQAGAAAPDDLQREIAQRLRGLTAG